MQAEKFDEHANSNPILALKGAKVSDFGGMFSCILAFYVLINGLRTTNLKTN